MDEMMPDYTEMSQKFFQYTVELMRSSAVSDSLNRLQRVRLNVNLVCYLIWYAQQAYGRIKKKQFVKLHQVVFAWNEEVVEELQRLQSMIALHQHEKMTTIRGWLHDEVDIAHQMERSLLLEAVPIGGVLRRNDQQLLSDACYNLVHYCKFSHVSLSDVELAELTIVLAEVFVDVSQEEVMEALVSQLKKAKLPSGGTVSSQLFL